MGNRTTQNLFVWIIIGVVGVAIAYTLFSNLGTSAEIGINNVIQLAREKQVRSITVDGDNLTITRIDGETLRSRKEPGSSIVEILDRAGVDVSAIQINVKGSSGLGNVFGLFINFLPLILLGAFLLFMMRQAQGSSNQTLSFGRSRARLFVGNRPTVTFADVAGVEEAKTELQEVVEFLKYPERFLSLGARIPKGVLLVGPPGTGKTLLARAVAGEAGVPFFSISGSEFVEMFVGVGAARVRDLFEQAKRNSPCIVFVDEIDAVGRHRGAGLGGGHDEREQTLNQILVEMDGFDTSTNVIVIAATNRPDILDPALLRPGRFDRRVILDQPDVQGRAAILKVHTRGKPLAPDVNLELIAKQTPGFSGADLANLVNEAAILAARRSKKVIGMTELQEAVDRVIAGPERRSRVISPKQKEITAFHEAGHALVGRLLPNADPVQKISIVSRGSMGGYTRFLPPEDRYLWTRAQFEDVIAVAMGGRAAEDLIFGDASTGASNDLENATRYARQMVTRYAMVATRPNYDVLPISSVMDQVRSGNIQHIEVYGNDLLVHTRDGKTFRSRKEADLSLVELLERLKASTGINGVQVSVHNSSGLGGLAPRVYGKREELVFLGREIAEERDYSDETGRLIDEEVDRIVRTAYERAIHALATHRDKLVHIAQYLIQHESVEGEDLERLFNNPVPQEIVEVAASMEPDVAREQPHDTQESPDQGPRRKPRRSLLKPPQPGPQAAPG